MCGLSETLQLVQYFMKFLLQGSGSGLLRRPHILESVVRCASNLLNIPFTVKTRVGVYSNQNIAHTLVPKFKEWGASMITVSCII